jgi:hypothetical protein
MRRAGPGAVHAELHAVDGFDVTNINMMSAADVAAASLAAMALGETVCIPALARPGAACAFDESRRNIFPAGISTGLVCAARSVGPSSDSDVV